MQQQKNLCVVKYKIWDFTRCCHTRHCNPLIFRFSKKAYFTVHNQHLKMQMILEPMKEVNVAKKERRWSKEQQNYNLISTIQQLWQSFSQISQLVIKFWLSLYLLSWLKLDKKNLENIGTICRWLCFHNFLFIPVRSAQNKVVLVGQVVSSRWLLRQFSERFSCYSNIQQYKNWPNKILDKDYETS